MMESKTKNCANCGVENCKNKCSACKEVFYCSVDCQKIAWNIHKSECNKICSRCEKSMSDKGECLIKHPISHRNDCGSMSSCSADGYKSEQSYSCSACSQKWMEITSFVGENEVIEIRGNEYCFRGKHSSALLDKSDKRFVNTRTVELFFNKDIQEQINSLDNTNVKILSIVNDSYTGNEKKIELNIKLPKLERIYMDKMTFKTLILSETNCPKLQSLKIINAGDMDKCDFQIRAPKLKQIHIEYMDVSRIETINTMLDYAKELVSFFSYKLWIAEGVLSFAGNDIKTIEVRRSDSLEGVTFWAPKLRTLNLIACYGFMPFHQKSEKFNPITILDDHDMKKALPDGFKPSKFRVDLTNCCLDNYALEIIKKHPRVINVIEPDTGDEY